MDGVAGFAVHHSMDCNIEFQMRGPTSVFTAEVAAIRMAMDQTENEALESRKISLHTHPFVYECKQKCWQLTRSDREVSFMLVPAHVGIAGNERADFKARQATLGNMVYKHNRLLEICFMSRNRKCWTNGRKVGKLLKQEGFRTPSFPGTLLDHGLRNGGRRENLLRLSRGLSRGTAELGPT
jgi:hypothetical protein